MTAPVYRTGKWKSVRRKVLERDHFQCKIRGPKCKGTATECDHIIPVSKGGSWLDQTNLRAACRPCNSGRADHTGIASADAEAVAGRLRALGLFEAAATVEREARVNRQTPTPTPSREW